MKRGEVDAVVMMYHDLGQIAINLMGFEHGVTVAGVGRQKRKRTMDGMA